MSITLNGTEGITLDNGSADGAQVTLASSGYSNWNLDNYSGRFRAYYGGTEQFSITSNGGVSFGSSGTAYGTSGQVLTSNGNAAPTWNTLSAVTSLNGQTGAITNTDLYAIGSYVTGRPKNTTSYAVNATLAGSSLWAIPSNALWDNGYPSFCFYTGTAQRLISGTLVNTGTWRCVSPSDYVNGGASGLWVRIS